MFSLNRERGGKVEDVHNKLLVMVDCNIKFGKEGL